MPKAIGCSAAGFGTAIKSGREKIGQMSDKCWLVVGYLPPFFVVVLYVYPVNGVPCYLILRPTRTYTTCLPGRIDRGSGGTKWARCLISHSPFGSLSPPRCLICLTSAPAASAEQRGNRVEVRSYISPTWRRIRASMIFLIFFLKAARHFLFFPNAS